MGCLYAKSRLIRKNVRTAANTETEKKYSWDIKKTIDPKDFMVENVIGAMVGRLPGTVNGQQFIIQNCQDSSIYIFDWINTITVDDCSNCNIFIGPTKGSIFLRDCSDCRFVCASQQLRTRDCKRLDVFLSCATQPSIESSTEMQFGCFSYHYPELETQFSQAGLSIFNNSWSQIYDFTLVEEKNWKLLPAEARVDDFLPKPAGEFSAMNINTDPSSSVVPQTLGNPKTNEKCCLIVFFSDGQAQKRVMTFIKEMNKSDNVLVRTKEMKMEAQDALRVFGTDSYNSIAEKGLAIALEYNGEDSINCCQNVAGLIATETGSTGQLYVSSSFKNAAKQIEQIFNCSNMQMSA